MRDWPQVTRDAAMTQHDQSAQASDFLDGYTSSATLLKAWLGTYSVGVPAFLFTHDKVLTKLVAQGRAACIAEVFACAIGLQVFVTFLNKYIQWGTYARHSPPATINWYTTFCEKASEWIWVDALVDATTIALLAWGSLVVFASLVAK
jgi:hypothetical protein